MGEKVNKDCGIIKVIFYVSSFILLLLLPSLMFAVEGSKDPINITSDNMEAETKANRVTFRGNVVARQKDMTITSNELIATYIDGGKELSDVVATGNVRITQQDKIAVADRALFLNTERKIILSGNPKVWQGKDIISGDKIIYFLDEDRTIVEGRTRAVIHPRKEGDFANPTGKGSN
ncbi:MAG: lipopolysaccharide ABC transporter periplasmic protein LptA [Deltaproteobacteria bacterium]|nr:lipopolysaccharide ABC transporter periplasmic protein LptA [Deltaproteobacteria bacterium]